MSLSPDLLIPVKKYTASPSRLELPRNSVVGSMESADADLGALLDAELRHSGRTAVFKPGNRTPEIRLIRDLSVRHPEGYILTVNRRSVSVNASTSAGTFYAVQTLIDLLRLQDGRPSCCRIEDEPGFNRRGLYMDCSRGKVPTVETVKSLVELLASWKMNELQLYIENVFTFRKHPSIGRGFSPFTAADILEMQAHCEKYRIRFVPSLSSFGHMEKILMLKRYSRLGEFPGWSGMPGGWTLCPEDPGSIRLVADLYDEFVPLFKSADFNVCCDEPWELGKGRTKANAARRGTGRVYLDFILKLRELCLEHGKRMNLWGDIVLEHPEILQLLPKDLVMLNWDYDRDRPGGRISRTREIAENGLPLVCCPGTNGWNSHGSRLSTAFGNVEDFTRAAVKNRSEGILHTDWGDGGHRNTLAVSLCSASHAAGFAWQPGAMKTGGHPERFCRRVFGDRSGRMADMIRTLGDESSGSWTYRALVQNLASTKLHYEYYGHDRWHDSPGFPWMRTQKFSAARIARRRKDLSGLSFSSKFKTGESFLDELLAQYDLAAAMDELAWERLSVHRAVASAAPGGRKILSDHRRRFVRLADRFSRIWLRTNRPSRLSDNMAAFGRSVRDMDRLIG